MVIRNDDRRWFDCYLFFALNPFNGRLIEAAAAITIVTIGNISYLELRFIGKNKFEITEIQ
jgi:hypothetical protein